MAPDRECSYNRFSVLHPKNSNTRVVPAQHAPIAIQHHPMKQTRVIIKHKRQELTVTFPQRKLVDLFDIHPLQSAFQIALVRLTTELRDHEQEPEPVFATLAKA